MQVRKSLPKIAFLASLSAAAIVFGAQKAMSAGKTASDCEAEFAAVRDDTKYPDLAAKIAKWSSSISARQRVRR
jgi:hypothetical protein